ncbi:phosphoenolpyruvate carboxykinase (ATP) [Candidatus Bipolaricaulota sp. J31]
MLTRLERILGEHRDVWCNPPRRELIAEAIRRREAIVAESGALATWTPRHSTGRRPSDTYIVDRPEVHDHIDWDSPYCNPLAPDVFEGILGDALRALSRKRRLYLLERALGADPRYALRVRILTDRALHALFVDNLFRPLPSDPSGLGAEPFHLLLLPYDHLDPDKYRGVLRFDPETGRTSDIVVAMDFARRVGVIIGSAYMGSVKKLMFTVMSYLLPGVGVLPLHCAANVGEEGDVALFLGLSGTGKTSLSTDPSRLLIGDDEHGWSDTGIFNLEGGCYAKLIGLSPQKEPGIWWAVMHRAPPLEHGAIIENAMVYPDGTLDLSDRRLTENSRASYPLRFLPHVVPEARGGHPTSIFFLTADAYGVLPPIARLDPAGAMFWFLMGYTSKLAGTETGVVEPVATFSRFFGEPFMPRLPGVYAGMLGEALRAHGARVYLVNTGWIDGSYGVGKRIDISLTRRMIAAAISGELEAVECRDDPLFKLRVPVACPGVPGKVLDPARIWPDVGAYRKKAEELAATFREHFERTFACADLPPEVAARCPGD